MSLDDLIRYQPAQPTELAPILGPDGIRLLLELIRDGYYALSVMGTVNDSMNENDVTEELCVHIQDLQKRSGRLSTIHVISQKEDRAKAKSRGKAPTIDICFRSKWQRNVYFGAECKLVEAHDKRLCDEYVKNGLARYLDGRYGSEFPEGAMIGYVFASECEAVANELHKRMQQLEGTPALDRSDRLLPFRNYHMSHHHRQASVTPFITIHHLLFTF